MELAAKISARMEDGSNPNEPIAGMIKVAVDNSRAGDRELANIYVTFLVTTGAAMFEEAERLSGLDYWTLMQDAVKKQRAESAKLAAGTETKGT